MKKCWIVRVENIDRHSEACRISHGVDFLTVQDIVRIHDRLIREHGATNVRDEGLLLSAGPFRDGLLWRLRMPTPVKWRPRTSFILMNHPFVDGNKRTAVAAAIVFLK